MFQFKICCISIFLRITNILPHSFLWKILKHGTKIQSWNDNFTIETFHYRCTYWSEISSYLRDKCAAPLLRLLFSVWLFSPTPSLTLVRSTGCSWRCRYRPLLSFLPYSITRNRDDEGRQASGAHLTLFGEDCLYVHLSLSSLSPSPSLTLSLCDHMSEWNERLTQRKDTNKERMPKMP